MRYVTYCYAIMKCQSHRLLVILAVALSVGLIIGCGDDNPTDSKNGAPSIPAIDVAGGAPADGSTGQPLVITLRWTCSDPDGDSVTYDVYFGVGSSSTKVVSDISKDYYDPDTLEFDSGYQWRVVAKDSQGNAASSPEWGFTTAVYTTTWTAVYGDTYYPIHGYSVCKAGADDYVVAGFTHEDVYLLKVDAMGDTVWTRTIDLGWNDKGYSVAPTEDGGYVVTGYTGGANWDVLLLKVDANGNDVWSTNHDAGNREYGLSVVSTTAGSIIVAGRTTSYGALQAYLIEFDSGGDTVWTRTYGEKSWFNSVIETSDGGYVSAGYIDRGYGRDVYLVKSDPHGDTLWTKILAGPHMEIESGNSVVQTADGGFLIVGSRGAAYSEKDVVLWRTDAAGAVVWEQSYGGSGNDVAASVTVTDDGGYVVAGYSDSYGAGEGSYAVYLLKVDASGTVVWMRTFGGTANEIAYGQSVISTNDGGYVIAGYRDPYPGSPGVYLIKTDAHGYVYE